MRRAEKWAAAALAAGIAIPSAATAATPAPYTLPPVPALVRVLGPNATAAPIPAGFLGLSMEYSSVLPYAGTNAAALDPVFLQLVRNLNPGQSPVLRIGGDSTDWSWWPVSGIKPPPGIRYAITPQWIATTNALAGALKAKLILGLNMEAGNAGILTAEANALTAGLRPHIQALEIGNEPELYGTLPWYDPPGGPLVIGRPPTWNVAQYVAQFASFSAAVPASLPIAGPAIGDYDWAAELPQFLAKQKHIGLVTLHRYALNSCLQNARSPSYAIVGNLLTRFASQNLVKQFNPLITLLQTQHYHLRIDEISSVTCGGKLGVSNTAAAALWALDTSFAMARAGISGLNFHTYHGGYNELFDFSQTGGPWSGTVRPIYYGLLMFAQAAPPGSRFLNIGGSNTGGYLRSWATQGPDGRERLVLINDSQTASYTVRIVGPRGTGLVERLTAPSAGATSGIALGGQSFPATTTTGQLNPGATGVTAPAEPRGSSLTLPPASAALITFSAPA